MATLKLSSDDIERIVAARHHAPRSVLGFHEVTGARGGRKWVVRVLEPDAESIALVWDTQRRSKPLGMTRLHGGGLFEVVMRPRKTLAPYLLKIRYQDGNTVTKHDSYFFSPEITDLDLYLFGEGNHHRIYEKLGAHPATRDGIAGTSFAVWAPAARRVSVVGDFNQWDGRKHTMQARESSGIWELFVPDVGPGTRYKYEIVTPEDSTRLKADPYGFAMQMRPDNCSVVADLAGYAWGDADWIARRDGRDPLAEPVNVYEVHLGSWKRVVDEENRFLSYDELADDLIAYVLDMGYTHIELMGVAEHPLDGSWGYQVAGYYAVNARHGDPQGFMGFVDRCHQAGIGVIMDWVPGHFPKDDHGLATFDGSHLYEHQDPRLGEHIDWGTKIFNYGRNEVRNFLVANALFWFDRYHIDGIRVDAVASMIYLDYSREPGQWIPNEFGGRENLAALAFLRQLNCAVFQHHPGALSVAEESTAFPGVTKPVHMGGLGFNLKWNMGWMNDTLRYMALDPVYRQHDANLLTFSFVYAWSENFILAISHDEVVHGKGALLDKMPGDDWQQRANLRLYLTYMMAHPGKQLLFMGCEFGQRTEWSEAHSLDWHLLEQDEHRGLQTFCRDLNHFYRDRPELYRSDFDPTGFEWIDCNDHARSVYSFIRRELAGEGGAWLVFAFNFTPVPRESCWIGVPQPGTYRVVLDTDDGRYGGSLFQGRTELVAEQVECHGRPFRIAVDLPPLGALALAWVEHGGSGTAD